MNKWESNIQRVFFILILLFVIAIVYLVLLVGNHAEEIYTNPYNPRLSYSDETILRGSIKDINGNILAESIREDDNSQTRRYFYKNTAVHITGHMGTGKTGVEAICNFILSGVKNEISTRLQSIINENEIYGNSVVLTVDIELQKKASEFLGNEKGAVIIMEPATGKILAMASSPSYDPSEAGGNWEKLRDAAGSPLLNRAVSGRYSPNTAFRIVTAIAAYRYLDEYDSFIYTCNGGGYCGDNAHGELNIEAAMKASCDCYFVELAKKVGSKRLGDAAESLMFSKPVKFDLGDVSSSSFIAPETEAETMEAGAGRGKTTVTPMHIAVLYSAAANKGMAMTPYIIDHTEYYSDKGYIKDKAAAPKINERLFSEREAEWLSEILLEEIDLKRSIEEEFSGDKDGVSDNAEEKRNIWLVGYLTDRSQKLIVTAVIEKNTEQ